MQCVRLARPPHQHWSETPDAGMSGHEDEIEAEIEAEIAERIAQRNAIRSWG
jgi:hypothetical protein